ncbi:MAG: hypothetical protein HYX27_13340 [Acidobacteria bacterium]|nr:hypothetical protein [Acidobacteriota bacterium]
MPHRLLVGVGVYLFALTYSCLYNYFDTDDMMNLYGAWHRFGDQVRPAGAIFYRTIFDVAGFQPLAFHIAGFVLIFFNLYLFSRLLNHFAGNRIAATAALLFGCFQGSMWMIYASTGMIYDVLCATFLHLALLIAIERPGRWILIGILQVAALSAKELGVSLPLLLLLYGVYYKPVSRKVLLLTALLSAGFVAQRFLIKNLLTGHEAYTPVFTWERIGSCVATYTTILFSHSLTFTPLAAVLFWLGLLAVAAAIRSWRMSFGILFFWAGLSPMLVGTPRHSGYVFYVSFIGLALAFGSLAAWIRAAVLAHQPRRFLRPVLTVLFLAVVVTVHYYQKRVTFKRSELPGGQDAIRTLAKIHLPLRQGQRVLILNSPGMASSYLGAFTLTLTHRVRDLDVVEEPWREGFRRSEAKYDHVLVFPPGRPDPIILSTLSLTMTADGRSPNISPTQNSAVDIQSTYLLRTPQTISKLSMHSPKNQSTAPNTTAPSSPVKNSFTDGARPIANPTAIPAKNPKLGILDAASSDKPIQRNNGRAMISAHVTTIPISAM